MVVFVVLLCLRRVNYNNKITIKEVCLKAKNKIEQKLKKIKMLII